jgi:ribosome-binding factor A
VRFHDRRRPRPPRMDEVRPEDAEARFFFDLQSVRPDHRVRSLCRQVQEAVLLALADVGGDPRLDGVWVMSVDPAPGPERLLVSVGLPKGAGAQEIDAALSALVERKPWLRSEVGRAIHRKRVPELAFRVALEAEGPDE